MKKFQFFSSYLLFARYSIFMISIGSSKAQIHFYTLLKRVSKGEQILITRRGIPKALLKPLSDNESMNMGARSMISAEDL